MLGPARCQLVRTVHVHALLRVLSRGRDVHPHDAAMTYAGMGVHCTVLFTGTS